MTQRAINYATALYELTPGKETVDQLRTLFEEAAPLAEVLADPMIPLAKKHQIIDDIAREAGFPANIKNFLKYLCDHRDTALLLNIVDAYDSLWEEKHNIIHAELLCAKSPEESEVEKTMDFLHREYPGKDIQTSLQVQENLLGGILIRVGHTEYDRSYEGRLRQLERKLTVR